MRPHLSGEAMIARREGHLSLEVATSKQVVNTPVVSPTPRSTKAVRTGLSKLKEEKGRRVNTVKIYQSMKLSKNGTQISSFQESCLLFLSFRMHTRSLILRHMMDA